MTHPSLHDLLATVRTRWVRRSMWRAVSEGAILAAVVVLAGWAVTRLMARDGLPLVLVTATVVGLALLAIVRAVRRIERPTSQQVARLVEEREPQLDDVLVTAVEYESRPDASARMREALFDDASRVVASTGLDGDVDRVISRAAVGQAGRYAAAAVTAFLLASVGFAPSVQRATAVAGVYLFPHRLSVHVSPGSVKLRQGQPLTINARTEGLAGEVVPTLSITIGDDSRSVRMEPASNAGEYSVTIDKVTTSFAYAVSAAQAKSDQFAVSVVHPPNVERIDIHYSFPRGTGLEPRTDQDSGDIYGPLGTAVRVSVVADKPIASAQLVMDDGVKVPLSATGEELEGHLTIRADGSYRIALADVDGLDNPGDTEYFIRTLDDGPPDVRIIRPASDQKVSPLAEVLIEARADDDFGIASFDLVFQSPNGKERTVSLGGGRGGLTAAARHTLFMEDLQVQPGDFVTYYARARDIARGRPSTEARSDIFFLEVEPFEEEFVAAQSQQQGGQSGGGESGLDQLIEAQKQIIVATWNIDARARRSKGAQSAADVKAVAKTQSELRQRAQQVAMQNLRMSDPRMRRRTAGAPPPGDDPVGKAVEAMGRAVTALEGGTAGPAIPHEMDALNQLLRADAEHRRRQVTRSQQAGGGGGQNRSQADLSSLFDQELRRRQSTNYETPNSTEARQETKTDDPLEAIRELARRQDALNRRQQELARSRAQMDADEFKRQLERLTREQNQLRQEAQEMAQQAERQQQQSGARGQNSRSDENRRLREASEDMRTAAAGMQREDTAQASASGARASDRLRDLERQMQTSRPDERRRALGDMQLEARQLADEQRRLADESRQAAQGQRGDDARRRLSAEQDRLAERTDRLQEGIERMSRAGPGTAEEQRGTSQAARDLNRDKVAERMRQAASGMREGTPTAPEQQALAESLERAAGQLGDAGGERSADAKRQSDQLAQAQELRDRINDLDRQVDRLRREGQAPGQAASAAGEGRSAPGDRAGTQRQVNDQMRAAGEMAESLRREHSEMPNTDAEWWRSFSAPGTEPSKQDFAKWDALKKHLLLALEGVESKLSSTLSAQQNQQRLNAGGREAVSEEYRELVEKYYKSLAAPRRPK